MKKIDSIKTIGGIDADTDELLMQCFQDHNSFNDIKELTKFIVLGRKGTGKTAIFKKFLNKRENNYFSYGHTFSDYPWHYHDKQAKIGVPNFDKYTHSWKYLILLTLSKILLNQDQSQPFDNRSLEMLSKIESFVLDSYGTKDPDVTQIFTPSKTLKIEKNLQVDLAVIKGGISAEGVPMEHLPKIIQEVNLNLSEYVLSSLNPDNSYHILFDQLDLGFEPTNPEYYNRVIGLLLAAKDINRMSKETGKKCQLLFSLETIFIIH